MRFKRGTLLIWSNVTIINKKSNAIYETEKMDNLMEQS